ncbi:MAG: hypothetical protein AVDCRST_MAG49-4181, partial [uncultured Thermomicrobiales bacterium]
GQAPSLEWTGGNHGRATGRRGGAGCGGFLSADDLSVAGRPRSRHRRITGEGPV